MHRTHDGLERSHRASKRRGTRWYTPALAAAALLAVCGSAPAVAQESVSDQALFATAAALITVDVLQSKDMVGDCADRCYREQNPLLGPYPGNGALDKAWAVSIAGLAIAHYTLPRTWNRRLLWGVVAVETAVVLNNHNIGLRVRF